MKKMRLLVSCFLALLTSSCIEALPAGEVPTPTEALPPVWDNWSPWSNCSRTCGSGVSSQQRSCLSNCVTEGQVEKRFQSCCIQDCPEGSPDFREQQCLQLRESRTDGNWTLVDDGSDECSLHCWDWQDVSGQIRSLRTYVAPGTPCRTGLGERGVCLGDQCAVVGCDGVLGSRKRRDGCLQCLDSDAEGSACHTHSDTVPHPPVAASEEADVTVLIVPANSTSISISHPLNCNEGRLALKLEANEYFFQRGNNATHFDVSGVTFSYHIAPSGDGYREELTATGPLVTPLKVELQGVIMGTAPSLTYTYHLLEDGPRTPISASPHHQHLPPAVTHALYTWKHMASSECSASCGRGLQTLVPMCVDEEFPTRPLVDIVCEFWKLVKPLPIVVPCNLQECPPNWITGEWSPCSQECGGGVQSRRVQCWQSMEEGRPPVLLTNSSCCPEETKPAEVRQCNTQGCHTAWVKGEWSQCSEEYADGVQCRSVQCQLLSPGPTALLDMAQCSSDTKPTAVRTCRLTNCIAGKCYGWVARKWKRCDNPCGRGNQTRNVHCQVYGGKMKAPDDSYCAGLELLPRERECWDSRGSCSPVWQVGDYGQCSGDCCGEQLQQRPVQCTAISNNQPVMFPHEFCASHSKPNTSRACQRPDCPEWDISEWEQCSAECGHSGLEQRLVRCSQMGSEVSKAQCCGLAPIEVRICQGPTCAPEPTSPCTDLYADICTTVTSQQCDGDFYQKLCCATCQNL